jgi:hypothetical protein
MGKETDDIEFNELLADKRHKELAGTLKGIASLLNQPKDNSIAEVLKQNMEATKGLVNVVKNLPKPEVNVEVNNEKIVTSLEAICNKIVASNNEVLDALKSKPMVDSFQVKPSGWNNTERTINVIYKPVDKITIKK